MSNTSRGIVKFLYYIVFIGIITVYYFPAKKDETFIVVILCYMIFGTILSSCLRLSLLKRTDFFKVDKSYYDNWDLAVNLVYFLFSIGFLIYYYLKA
jgi:hypothetical protein